MVQWIERWVLAGPTDEEPQSRDALMLHAILLSVLVLLGFMFAVHIPFVAANKPAALAICTVWLLTTLVAWWLKGRGLIRPAALLHCSVLYVLSAAVAVFAPAVQAMMLIPAVMHWGVLIGLRAAAIAGALSIGIAFFAALGGREAVGLPLVFTSPPIAVAGLFVMPLLLTIVPVALYMHVQRRVLQRLDGELAARRQAETNLQQANELLEAKVKLRTAELLRANEELTKFSQRAAHDIRGAIGQVTGYVSLALRHPVVREVQPAAQHLERASEAGDHLAQLVGSLLGLATLGARSLDWQVIDLERMIAGVRDEMMVANPGRIIHWEIAPLGSCTGDPVLVRTVFQNLIGNAVKFTRNRDDARINISRIALPDTFAEICVADNGVGFDTAQAERVFGGFQRLHSSAEFEGHGIGLASCRKIITMHGGEIRASAQVDQGARFFLTLPTTLPKPEGP